VRSWSRGLYGALVITTGRRPRFTSGTSFRESSSILPPPVCCWHGTEAGMSASTIGAQMPAEITLDDVAAMAEADEHHRYELSGEGVLSIMPPATPEHALTVSRLAHWFYLNGYGPEQVTADCSIDVGGGRQPDLTIWAKAKPPKRARSSYAGLDGL